MKEFSYILFDLDGTLTEPKEGITKSVAYALESFGIQAPDLDELCVFIGPPLKDSFMKYYGFDDEKAEVAVERYREYFRPYGVYENEVYEGIPEMLKALYAQGKTLVLATSKPTVFAEIILKHFGLRSYFSHVIGSELDGTRVKKDEVVACALEESGVTDLEEAVMIGDREHDIFGAKKNGLFSIGVLYGHGSLVELEKSGADEIVGSVRELATKLGVSS